MSSTEQKLKICENKNNNKHSQRRSGKPGWSSEEGKTNLVANRETHTHIYTVLYNVYYMCIVICQLDKYIDY